VFYNITIFVVRLAVHANCIITHTVSVTIHAYCIITYTIRIAIHVHCVAQQETVIYTDGKTMEVDDGKTREKIEKVQSQLKEESASTQPIAVSSATGTTSSSSACYNSLPTMVGLNSVLAPSPGSASQSELANEDSESSRSSVKGHEVFSSSQVKFKCGYK